MNTTCLPLRAALGAALAAAALLALTGTALGHAEAVPTGTPKAGAAGTIIMHIGHGCEDAAGRTYDTDRIVVQLPAGFTNVTGPKHAGWVGTVAATGAGTRVQWKTTGAKLGKHTHGEFSIRMTYPSRKGSYGLPTVQYCANRSTAWIEKPVGGVEPDLPLPMITVR